MKIALIYPPFHHKIFSENLKVVDEEFCLAPPIILAYVAAILERAGHKVKLIDANAQRLSMGETLNILEGFRPDLLGARLETYHFYETLNWIRYLKQHLKVPVIAGGNNHSLSRGIDPPQFIFFIRACPKVSIPIKTQSIRASCGLHKS